jgi:hypothetical protein
MDSHTITAIKEEPNPFEESFLSASFPVKIEHPVKVVGHDQLLDICPSDITYNNPKSRPVIGNYILIQLGFNKGELFKRALY